jgi:hypothetical protein
MARLSLRRFSLMIGAAIDKGKSFWLSPVHFGEIRT